jgi:FkbM family methyltransferase
MTRARYVLVGLILGTLVGAIAAVAAVRMSRNPGNPLYTLRARIATPAQDRSEANWLERTYGPDRQSMNLEEWIIRDFFQDRRGGFFLDVGAADQKVSSNTWYLENRLGWSGIAIDALQEYRAGYEQFRPRTKFFSVFVSDQPAGTATLFIGSGRGASSGERGFTEQYGAVTGSVEVPTTTLNQLLDAEGVTHVDFVSMDIELAEPKALAGFDLDRFKPALVAVELHPEVRQQILDYFATRGYVVIGKYLRADDINAWFMPAGTRVAPFPFHIQP